MVQIIDWYGNTKEIDPLEFANEEYHYPNAHPYGRCMLVKNRELIKYCGYEDPAVFYREPDYPAKYLYNRIVAEVELALGWRIHNGYLFDNSVVSVKDIAKALEHYTYLPNKTSSSISIDQRHELRRLIFTTDEALYITNPPIDSIKKLILFVYASCVKQQPPEVAYQACRSNDAKYYLDRYGVEDKMWQKTMDDRIMVERKKLKLV